MQSDTINKYLLTQPKENPVKWIERNLSLRYDFSSASDGYVELEPYQIRPILAQYQAEVFEVTIMAVEQTGKSSCWRFPLIHKLLRYPGPRWIIYESDEKAEDINEEQLKPMLKGVPEIQPMLSRFTAFKSRYQLPNGSIVDFSGAGADITSKPKRDGVADELDTWPLSEDNIRQNLRNFRKRFRTYWARGEGCLVKVSSPSPRKKGEQQDLTRSAIDDEFQHSDGGYWTLRCLNCGKLTIPSHATYNLQWGTTEDEEPYDIVLDCPKCKHSHREYEAQEMNNRGGYIDKHGAVLWCREEGIETWTRSVGCQWGALACPRAIHWEDIARAQLASGSTADFYAQADFDNSWRGIGFRPRKKDPPGMDTIKKHCADYPDPSILANVFFSADTQDNGWYWVVRGVDAKTNFYLLDYGFVRTPSELKQVWDSEYLGIMPIMGIIDEGGHGVMPKYVRELVETEQGLYAYKGTSGGQYTRWNKAKEPYTILGVARRYQADLLTYIYSQEDDAEQNYWYLPPVDDCTDDYLQQIAALQKNNRSKYGHEPENWEPPDKQTPDHYFDAEKQILCIYDVALAVLPQKKWRREVETFQRRGIKRRDRRKAPEMELV